MPSHAQPIFPLCALRPCCFAAAQKVEFSMEISSGLTAMLVIAPLLAILAAGFFRIDELMGKPKKTYRRIPLAGGIDEHGIPIGLDPDGRPLRNARRTS